MESSFIGRDQDNGRTEHPIFVLSDPQHEGEKVVVRYFKR